MEDNFFKRSAPRAYPNPTSKNLRPENSKPKRVGVDEGSELEAFRVKVITHSHQCATERVREFFGAGGNAAEAARPAGLLPRARLICDGRAGCIPISRAARSSDAGAVAALICKISC